MTAVIADSMVQTTHAAQQIEPFAILIRLCGQICCVVRARRRVAMNRHRGAYLVGKCAKWTSMIP